MAGRNLEGQDDAWLLFDFFPDLTNYLETIFLGLNRQSCILGIALAYDL
jgi:hypothetical protein